MSPAETDGLCSSVSQLLDESAYGSAAVARAWVCLEQNGPWGRTAATTSHLDPAVGDALDRSVSAANGRFALIRRPGRHPDDGAPEHRDHAVLVACADPARPWLLSGHAADPRALLSLDVAALAGGDADAVRASVPDVDLAPDPRPRLLVCTNGRRDLCCAVRGRPVALAAATRRPGQVWETSHTGGHRFAPTAVLLPSGQMLARLDADLAVLALDGAARGELPARLHGPRHDRGRSGLTPAAQAAESAVRRESGETSLAGLTSRVEDRGDDRWLVEVTQRDGLAVHLEVRRTTGPAARPPSCGKDAEPMSALSVSPLGAALPEGFLPPSGNDPSA